MRENARKALTTGPLPKANQSPVHTRIGSGVWTRLQITWPASLFCSVIYNDDTQMTPQLP